MVTVQKSKNKSERKKMELTERDRMLIMSARKAGVLCDVDGAKINGAMGIIFGGCSDGDHLLEKLHHLCEVAKTHRQHSTLLNGGPLLISPWSPIPDAGIDGAVLLRHMKSAVPLKGIQTIVLCTHAPCGAAYKADLDFLEVLRLLMEAKARVRKELNTEKIHCFCHVHYGGNQKRTYAVRRQKALEFLEEQKRPVRSF